MKKLISYLLITAMLLGCIAPSAIIFAGTSPALVAKNVEKMEGAGSSVAATVTIENNPGLTHLYFLVYYDASELARGDTEDAFANSVFSTEDSVIGSQVRGTNIRVKNYIPEELRATSNAFIVQLYGFYGENAVYEDGVVVELPFEIIADELGTLEYTVVLIDASDENGNDVEIAGSSAAINYVADPLIGIYDEFTVFTDPGDKDILAGTDEISIDVRFDNNPGIWSARFFVVYPEELSLKNVENSLAVFTSPSDMLVGTPDLDLTDPSQVGPFQGYLADHPEIVKPGYRSTTIYFEPATFDAVLDGNGILCTLNFEIASDVESGDVLDISMHYTEADFIRAETDVDGTPIFTIYNPQLIGSNLTIVEKVCYHTNTTEDHKDATCGEAGYDRVICTECGRTISEELIPATGLHVEGDAVCTKPTCEEDGKFVYNCTVCGEFLREETIPAHGHSYLQIHGSVIVPPTCTEDGYTTRFCDYCGEPRVIDPTPALGHDEDGGVDVEYATCIADGSITTYCSTCGEVSKFEVIPVTGTHNLKYVAAVEPGCHRTGNVEYWYCVDCDAVYTDAEGRYLSNRKNVIVPALNELAYVPAAESCHVPGSAEYWYCPDCEAVYADAAGTILTNRKNLAIAPDCELVHMDAVEPCHANGTYEYWYCPECEAVYADEAGTILTNRKNLTIPAAAEVKHVAKVDPTCTENGTYEYWYCEECDTHFADAECKYNVAYLSLVIPAKGHDFVGAACVNCGFGSTLTGETVEKMKGTGTSVSPKVTIENNIGLTALSFLVYYNSSELAQGDVESALENSVFSAEDSIIGPQSKGTINKFEKYIPEELRATSNAFIVELYGINGGVVSEDGIVIELPFEIIADEIGSLEYTVVFMEAYDKNGNNVELTGSSATVNYVPDPLVGIYDSFTVFTNPGDKDVLVGTDKISVDVRFDNNPGLWSTRIFVVYPEELSLESVENSLAIYTSKSDMFTGYFDIDLNSPLLVDSFRDYLAANPEIVKDGYRSTVIYFEPEEFDAIVDGNGILCTLNFDIASDVENGDVLDIRIYYTEDDFLRAESDENGLPLFTSFYPETIGSDITIVDKICEHIEGNAVITNPTCVKNGSVEYRCSVCGRTIRKETIPALGHDTAGEIVTVPATCVKPGTKTTYCDTCGEVSKVEKIEPTGKHDLIYVEAVDATCTADGNLEHWYCSMCGGIYLDAEGQNLSDIKAVTDFATGHTEEELVVVEPTCTGKGRSVYFCSVCEDIIRTETVPAKGHTEGAPVVLYNPTCVLEGKEEYYCTVCSEFVRIGNIPATGHTEEKGICSVCGATDVVPEGLEYTISNGEVIITGYTGNKSELYIPYAIEGCPVTVVYPDICSSGIVDRVILSEKMERVRIVDDIRIYAIIKELYILNADMKVQLVSNSDSQFIGTLFYMGTYDEFASHVSNNFCVVNVICDYGTPMEGFVYTTNEDVGTIMIIDYNGVKTDIVIPAEYRGYRVTAIAPGALSGRNDITSISIPGTVEFIEENTFRDCTNLVSVTIGEGTCEIGEYAFSGCSSLEEIILPESIVYIWMYAFNRCVGLTKVYFPSCLEVIEYKAFYRCENIYDVTYNGSPSEFEKIYLGNGNDPILMTNINYLEEDEAKIVMIPVPEGMDPEDCQLYYVDENGVATALQVEFVDGHFVVVETAGQEEMTGYYIVRNSTGDEPDLPEIPDGVVIGDVDGDGNVTSLDANALQRILSGKVEAPEGSDKYIASDINRDGEISVLDVNMFKRLISGVITI